MKNGNFDLMKLNLMIIPLKILISSINESQLQLILLAMKGKEQK